MSNILKMSNAGGMKSLMRYHDMLAGNTVWANPGWESIASYNAGATSAITFSSIPSGYKSLRLVTRLRDQRTSAPYSSSAMSFNGGPTGSAYAYQAVYGDERTASPFEDSSSATSSFPLVTAGASGYISTGSVYAYSFIDIFDYSNASKATSIKGFSGYIDPSNAYSVPSQVFYEFAGVWNSLTTVNSITLTPANPNYAGSVRASLYGLKG